MNGEPNQSLFDTPAALIPSDAFTSRRSLTLEAAAIRDLLASKVAAEGYASETVAAFAEVTLRAFSLDGAPIGAGILPAYTRTVDTLPLSAQLLSLMVTELAAVTDETDLLPEAEGIIERLGLALRELAISGNYPVLLQMPDLAANPLFAYHWRTHAAPLYPIVAARIHHDLVWRLSRGRYVNRLLTPYTRITLAFPAERLPPPLYVLDEDQEAAHTFCANVRDVVAHLPNLNNPAAHLAQETTQPKYYTQFIYALRIACLQPRGRSLILHPIPRGRWPDFEMLDTDPPEEPGDPLNARLYDQTADAEALDEDDLFIEREWLASRLEFPDQLTTLDDLTGTAVRDAMRRRDYARERAVTRHVLLPSDWQAAQPMDLALGYVTLLDGRPPTQLPLGDLALLVFYDLLVVTGRPWRWLLEVEVGSKPDDPAYCPHPILDVSTWEIHFTPRTYPMLPCRLRPPQPDGEGQVDEEAQAAFEAAWDEHRQLYDEVSPTWALPLDPRACVLLNLYLEARQRTLAAGPLSRGLDATANRGPLFLTSDRNGAVRPLDKRDVAGMIERINRFRREKGKRPHAPAVSRPRIRRAAVTHLRQGGLNDVFTFYITGRHLPGLRAPLFYTLVDSRDLARAYHEAVARYRQRLSRAYASIRHDGFPQALPWIRPSVPEPPITPLRRYYGAVYHPRLERIRAVLGALLEAARHSPAGGVADAEALQRAHHDALTLLAAYLLALFLGLRISEVGSLTRAQIDLRARLITIRGKRDRFYEEYRVLPIPPPLLPLLRQVLELSARSGAGGLTGPALTVYGGLRHARAATPYRLWRYLNRIGAGAGLGDVTPKWHSARHFLRTFLLAQGLDEATINYILGHQTEGNEIGNRFTPSNLPEIFETYRKATLALAATLELDFDGIL